MVLKILKLLVVLGVGVVLTGCQEEYRVKLVDGSAAMVSATFEVEEIAAKDFAKLHTVRMYDQNDSLIWHLKRGSGDESGGIHHVRYGVVPRGFDVEVPATSLQPGNAYTLVVQGSGYGVLRFAVNSTGYLIPLKHELSHF